jgi:hypothetical protein
MPRKARLTTDSPRERKPWRQKTTLTFSTQDLLALTRLVAAGQVVLNTTHPVVSRLKAAITRMGLIVPQGL